MDNLNAILLQLAQASAQAQRPLPLAAPVFSDLQAAPHPHSALLPNRNGPSLAPLAEFGGRQATQNVSCQKVPNMGPLKDLLANIKSAQELGRTSSGLAPRVGQPATSQARSSEALSKILHQMTTPQAPGQPTVQQTISTAMKKSLIDGDGSNLKSGLAAQQLQIASAASAGPKVNPLGVGTLAKQVNGLQLASAANSSISNNQATIHALAKLLSGATTRNSEIFEPRRCHTSSFHAGVRPQIPTLGEAALAGMAARREISSGLLRKDSNNSGEAGHNNSMPIAQQILDVMQKLQQSRDLGQQQHQPQSQFQLSSSTLPSPSKGQEDARLPPSSKNAPFHFNKCKSTGPDTTSENMADLGSERPQSGKKSGTIIYDSNDQPVGCIHKKKKVYALNMCHNCYHKYGKPKKATQCPHTDVPHYASGVCQKCYLARYYLKKKKPQMKKKADSRAEEPASPSGQPDIKLAAENSIQNGVSKNAPSSAAQSEGSSVEAPEKEAEAGGERGGLLGKKRALSLEEREPASLSRRKY